MATLDARELAKRTAAALRAQAAQVEATPPLIEKKWSVAFSELNNGRELRSQLMTQFGNGPAIYAIKAVEATREEVEQSFTRHRSSSVSYPRLNADSDSDWLYVGSGAGVTSRLNEHLNHAHPKTYALHMDGWATGIRGTLSVSVLGCGEVSPAIMGVIEDQLWDELRPMFGRRGRR